MVRQGRRAPAEAGFPLKMGSDGALLPSFLKKFEKFLGRTAVGGKVGLTSLFTCNLDN